MYAYPVYAPVYKAHATIKRLENTRNEIHAEKASDYCLLYAYGAAGAMWGWADCDLISMQYLYRCQACGKITPHERPYTKRNEPVVCACGEQAVRAWDAELPTKQFRIPYSYHHASRRDEHHLPTTEAEKQVWKERSGIDPDAIRISLYTPNRNT